MKKAPSFLATALAPLALYGCALGTPPRDPGTPVASAWQAPLPHNGSLTDLSQWWRNQGDPLLAQLVDAAEADSPTLAAARSRIAQARAQRVAAGAALAPTLDTALSVARTSQQSTLPSGTTSQLALQAGWEIDLFGARRAQRNAAQAQLAGAQAGWHEARVSVAAEVANAYYGLRACERLLAVALQDAASRADTARLTGLTAGAGFQAPATAALARASAADGNSRATAQRAQCDLDVKALVALTALPESQLRERLAATLPVAAPPLAFTSLPAQTLAQRPDVYRAEQEVAAASFQVGSAEAQRYPRLTLQGSVGLANLRSGGQSLNLDTWSIGPLALNLPVFDAGRRRADIDAAVAGYDAAVITYRAQARQAVREVEEALVNLNSLQSRRVDAQVAMEGYQLSFRAAEDRFKNGLGSLLELEDARRTRLAAENAVITIEQAGDAAQVALYRALGGGWTRAGNTRTH